MQAKDIDAADVVRVVADVQAAQKRWVFMRDITPRFPTVPRKVLIAKLNSLIRRKLLTGCTCGCRGDFETTESGRALLIRDAAVRLPPDDLTRP
jgi:hypothetical protein